MTISNDIRAVGVNDHVTDLFEGQYAIPNGISYNSYVILDEKVAVLDTVDKRFTHQWLDNLQQALDGREPDVLVVQHMEPDHSGSVAAFLALYPRATVAASSKAFAMMGAFFGTDFALRRLVVGEGDTLSLGRHTLTFYTAPMVHWPEVLVTYDDRDRVLFSADAFGKFGALDVQEDWTDEARRYYVGIVGKYGTQVQALLNKAAGLDIGIICPLHGPVLTENLGDYLDLYRTWSSYRPETEGVLIACASIYGSTKAAAELLADDLRARGCPSVTVTDLARCDMALATADAFRYSKLVLACATYNADLFPPMRTFLRQLTERGWRGRTVALMENGSWSPQAVKVMRELLAQSRDLTFVSTTVTIRSTLDGDSRARLEAMADELCRDYLAQRGETADKNDRTALLRIGYGLYVVTCRDGKKDNGLVVNTVTQVTNAPDRVAVTINKDNYSHHVIRQTGVMNVNCLAGDAPFELIRTFGFQSGRTADKFAGLTPLRSDNGLAFLPRHVNALLSLKVEQYVDLDTHGMFLCSVTEARVLSGAPTMTYADYHDHVKPKPETEGKKGFVCKVCGWVYEGDTLPDDIICPLCKHGAADFEPVS